MKEPLDKVSATRRPDLTVPNERAGVIFDIKRYALHDGPGIRTTVFFKGCPLWCAWCANAEGRSDEREVQITAGRCIRCLSCVEICPQGAVSVDEAGVAIDRVGCAQCGACVEACPSEALLLVGESVSVDELMTRIERDRLFFDESGGGVTFSGGEPLMQADFLLGCLQACRERELHTVVDTSGAVAGETLTAVAAYTDLFLYDVKLVDDAQHQEQIGVSSKLVLDNLRQLVADGKQVWIRVPLIPGVNDDPGSITALAEFVRTLAPMPPVYLLPYHRIGQEKPVRLGRPKTMDDVPPATDTQVAQIAQRLKALGLDVKIGG